MSVVDPPPTDRPSQVRTSCSLGTGPFAIPGAMAGVNSNAIGGRSLRLGVGAGRINSDAATPTMAALTMIMAFFTQASS